MQSLRKAIPLLSRKPAPPPKTAPTAVTTLPLDAIEPSPYQPRLRPIKKVDVEELMASLAAAGQTTPVIVTAIDSEGDDPDRYHVHAGHRRCAALRFLGRDTVEAIIREGMTEREIRTLVLSSNLGRTDLSAYEQAVALRDYADAYDLTIEKVAKDLGLTRKTAFRLNAILSASETLQVVFKETGIAAKPADLLTKIEKKDKRRAKRLAEKYVAGAIKSKDLEQALRAKPGSKVSTETGAANSDVLLKVTPTAFTLRIRLARFGLTAGDKMRTVEAMARLLGHLDISRMDAIVPEQADDAEADDHTEEAA